MKTLFTTIIAIFAFTLTCSAQWYSSGGTNTYLISTYTNVGIGTTAPGTWLHIRESTPRTTFTGSGLGTMFLVNAAGNTNYTSLDFSGGSTIVNAEARIAALQTSSGSYLQFGTSNSYATGITNTAMTIDPSGRVGIGTATPSRKFVVTGTSNAPDVGILSVTTGTGASTDETLQFGVHDGDYSWVQAVKIGTGYRNLALSPNGGNVGIGNTAPIYLLDANQSNTGGTIARVLNPTAGTGNFGQFRVESDAAVLTETSLSSTWTTSGVNVQSGSAIVGTGAGGLSVAANNATGVLRFYTAGNSSINERMRIDASGNVGIGTISPDQALTVNGQVHSTSVVVTSTVPTPDYVFNTDYTLRPLADLKAYVDKNHHLPEVSSAAEMQKNGQNLGEMNMTLLKKVEELTLYMIELNKKVVEQQKVIDSLKSK